MTRSYSNTELKTLLHKVLSFIPYNIVELISDYQYDFTILFSGRHSSSWIWTPYVYKNIVVKFGESQIQFFRFGSEQYIKTVNIIDRIWHFILRKDDNIWGFYYETTYERDLINFRKVWHINFTMLLVSEFDDSMISYEIKPYSSITYCNTTCYLLTKDMMSNNVCIQCLNPFKKEEIKIIKLQPFRVDDPIDVYYKLIVNQNTIYVLFINTQYLEVTSYINSKLVNECEITKSMLEKTYIDSNPGCYCVSDNILCISIYEIYNEPVCHGPDIMRNLIKRKEGLLFIDLVKKVIIKKIFFDSQYSGNIINCHDPNVFILNDRTKLYKFEKLII